MLVCAKGMLTSLQDGLLEPAIHNNTGSLLALLPTSLPGEAKRSAQLSLRVMARGTASTAVG